MKNDSERVTKMSAPIKTESGKIIKEGKPAGSETLEGKDVILAILGRAADESEFLARLADDGDDGRRPVSQSVLGTRRLSHLWRL